MSSAQPGWSTYELLNEAIVAAIAAIGHVTDRHDDRVAS